MRFHMDFHTFSHSFLNHSIQGHVLGRESCRWPEAQLAGPTQKRTSKSLSCMQGVLLGLVPGMPRVPAPVPGLHFFLSSSFQLFEKVSWGLEAIMLWQRKRLRIIHGTFMRGVPAAVCPGPSPEDARARCFSVIACSLTVVRCPTK